VSPPRPCRGRDHDRHALLAQVADAIPHEQARRRVKAGARLVQEEHLGCVHHRPGDHDPLRLAARDEVDLVGRPVGEPEQLEEFVGAPVALGRRDAVVRGVEGQVLADRERAVEVVALRHHGEDAARPHGVGGDVDADHPGGARAQPDAGREHADRGRLAGAVWSEQPKHLAAVDGERDAVHGIRGRLRIALLEPLHLDRKPALIGRRRDLKRRTHRREG
jgi:hypothetical protein